MDGPLSLFPLGSLCEECPFLDVCGADRTDRACREQQRAEDPGGIHALHPRSPGLSLRVSHVGGLAFDEVEAKPVAPLQLPAYIPQLRLDCGRLGHLDAGWYAVRPNAVLRRGRILPASEVRRKLGLRDGQKLMLLLFDRDKILERLFDPAMILSIAEARYDAVVSPSYSAWSPRPRTETLFNAKRSLVYFAAMQLVDVPSVARVVWEVERDVQRYATWAERNPAVRLVAIDLQTYRSNRDFGHQMDGLLRFDALTAGRLSYLVNGPTVAARIKALFETVPGRRLHLTNATAHLGLRERRGKPGLAEVADRAERFARQTALGEAVVACAATDSLRRAA